MVFYLAEGVLHAQQELGYHGKQWIHWEHPWVIPSEQTQCSMVLLSVLWLQGRQVQPPLLASACRNADLSAPARELHQWKRILNHCKVCAGKSRRTQICLCCHSHFSSACSEGMELKGCSGSWKGGEETNVNRNRLRCQSVSDVFGYPLMKVSKHLKVLPWELSQRRLSSPWVSSLWIQTIISAFLQAEWKGFLALEWYFLAQDVFAWAMYVHLYVFFKILISKLFCESAAVTSSTRF